MYTAKSMDSYEFVDGVAKKLVMSDKVDPCTVKGAELGVYDLVMCGGEKGVEHLPDSLIYDAPSVYYELNKREKIGKRYPWGSCPLLTVGNEFFTSGEIVPCRVTRFGTCVALHLAPYVRLRHGLPEEQSLFSRILNSHRKSSCQRHHWETRILFQRVGRRLQLSRSRGRSVQFRVGRYGSGHLHLHCLLPGCGLGARNPR